MPHETDEIDELVRAAAKAHEGLAAPDYFDGLPARVMARLARSSREPEAHEVAMMSDTENDSPRGATPPPVAERTEDSGLHDVKSLARTTKQRISRRITSQHDAYDDSLLSSSQSGLRAVALPAPAQVVSLPDLPAGAPGAATAVARGGAGDITPIATARSKKTLWLLAAGGVVAAAAVAVVVITSGGAKKDAGQVAAAGSASASGEQRMAEHAAAPAATAPSAGEGSAAGSATTVTAVEPAAPPAETEEAGGADTGGGTAGDKAEAPSDRDRASSRSDAKPDTRGSTDHTGRAADKSAPRGAAGSGKTKAEDNKAGGGGGGGGAGGGGGDSMEDLLAAASGGAQQPTKGGDDAPAKPEKTSLDGKDIRTGMGAVAGKAQGCYDKHGVAGHVKVKAVVDPSGKVTKVDATGEFAGTPTGSCVADAAKSASFPAWTGAPMTITYGFTLQE